MKKQSHRTPTRCKFSIFRQLCNLIPNHLVPQLARDTGAAEKSRSFKPWSHVVSLLFAQFTHAVGLNDVCDSLRLHSGPLSAIRGATPPSRNGLSTANRQRPAALAEQLFWKTLEHLQSLSPAFGTGRAGKRLAHRFKAAIHVVDATTIQLVANALDWARHRRRKAAAKCHLRLDLHSFLPRFVLIDTARDNDARRAREVCAAIRAGEIVLFDKAYVDFDHLHDLNERGVFWVTRAKDNLQFKAAQRRIKKPAGNIVRDDEILLTGPRSRADYPPRLRRVVALVEVDGVEREMVFLTNNFQWAASTVAELYRCRWQIEVFFKQIKQTLQLADFLGNSANAVRWQVWTALLVYV
ncbi:MAG: IS4 family transposase, partial [Terriglobales bacterium]